MRCCSSRVLFLYLLMTLSASSLTFMELIWMRLCVPLLPLSRPTPERFFRVWPLSPCLLFTIPLLRHSALPSFLLPSRRGNVFGCVIRFLHATRWCATCVVGFRAWLTEPVLIFFWSKGVCCGLDWSSMLWCYRGSGVSRNEWIRWSIAALPTISRAILCGPAGSSRLVSRVVIVAGRCVSTICCGAGSTGFGSWLPSSILVGVAFLFWSLVRPRVILALSLRSWVWCSFFGVFLGRVFFVWVKICGTCFWASFGSVWIAAWRSGFFREKVRGIARGKKMGSVLLGWELIACYFIN